MTAPAKQGAWAIVDKAGTLLAGTCSATKDAAWGRWCSPGYVEHYTELGYRAIPVTILPEQEAKDGERLDWLDKQWADGVHVEVCATGSFSGCNLAKVATVYVGDAKHSATTVREAIDTALSAKEGTK